MSKQLPSRPNLEQLKNQAKDLLKAIHAHDPLAEKRVRGIQPTATYQPDAFTLTEAQLIVAREYGFESWSKLKQYVASVNEPVPVLQQLISAFHQGDAPRLAELLAEHPEFRSRINQPLPEGAFGCTPLLFAVQQGNRAMVEVLLDAGADINGRSQWWAGSFGVLDSPSPLTPFLLERGARVDIHAAARLGMFDKVKELLAQNPALVHARGGDGQTPLHFAASIEIAEYLLKQGADMDALDIDHESTPAQYMLRERQE